MAKVEFAKNEVLYGILRVRARQDLKLRSWINVASIKQSNPRTCSNHCNFPCSRPRFLVVRIVKAKSSTPYVHHADRPLLYELSSSHEPCYHFVYACFREWQRFQLLKNCSVWFACLHFNSSFIKPSALCSVVWQPGHVLLFQLSWIAR
jgi:hypothetical protein